MLCPFDRARRPDRVARAFAVVLSSFCLATAPGAWGEEYPFDAPGWRFEAETAAIVEHLGRMSLELKGGFAWLPELEFRDGTITFDMAFSRERGFSGAAFRMADTANYEHFYVRPHQSGQPDANQYTPVFNGVSGWQLYHGPGYGAATDYAFDQWISVTIVVSGTRARVYLGDTRTPLLEIPELKRDVQSGAVGLNASTFAPAFFSNFRVEAGTVPLPASAPTDPAPADPLLVSSWEISRTFDGASLAGRFRLEAGDKADLDWQPLAIEPGGFANIARIRRLEAGGDTVFARLVIESPSARSVLLDFGYSDSARVFLNDRLIYSGDNTYQSRDYRYLGTIGLFDSVALDLDAGANELLIAVTERFGGWGVMARIEASAGKTR